jgi:hypothetical protein
MEFRASQTPKGHPNRGSPIVSDHAFTAKESAFWEKEGGKGAGADIFRRQAKFQRRGLAIWSLRRQPSAQMAYEGVKAGPEGRVLSSTYPFG